MLQYMVPTNTLTILSGFLPLDLCVGFERDNVTLTRERESVEIPYLSPEMVDICNSVPLMHNLWRLLWAQDMRPVTLYLYFTDKYKQQDCTVGGAFLVMA